MSLLMRLTVVAWVAGAFCAWTRAAEPIRPAQFESLHALIKPTPVEEKWSQIPWLTSLWDARQKAAAAGKPILLWEMDGHPLGCV